MKVNNIIKNPKWKKIPCCCNHGSVMTEYPISECLHCKFEECEKSLPKKDFEVNDDVIDKNGKVTKKKTRTVKEITIVRGDKYQDIIGWTF